MKKYIILIFITAFVSFSCNNKEVDKLIEQQKEIESLKREKEKIINENAKTIDSLKLLISKKSITKVKNVVNSQEIKTKYYTEAEAINYVKDYYSFYKKDYLVQNIKVRRISNNIFHVSLEEESRNILKIKKNIARLEETDLVWDSSNYKLTIYNSKEYKLE